VLKLLAGLQYHIDSEFRPISKKFLGGRGLPKHILDDLRKKRCRNMSVWRYVRELLLYSSGSDADSGKWGILPLAEVIFSWDDPRFIIHREHSASGQIDALAFIPLMQKIRMGSINRPQRSFLLFCMNFLEIIPLSLHSLKT
jgi:hypothetical protein